MGESLRIMSKTLVKALDRSFDELNENLDRISEITDKILRAIYKRLRGVEHDARQPRFTRRQTYSQTPRLASVPSTLHTADRVMIGDSSSAQVDSDSMCLTTFGDDSIVRLALPSCKDGALIDKSAAAPKPCLLPVEMRTLVAASGLLPAGVASTATRTIFSPAASLVLLDLRDEF